MGVLKNKGGYSCNTAGWVSHGRLDASVPASQHALVAYQHPPSYHTTPQVCLFANDTTVTKGMVKYASQITRESIIDVEGLITCPEKPVEGCSQSEVRRCTSAQLGGVMCISQYSSSLGGLQKAARVTGGCIQLGKRCVLGSSAAA